MRRPGFHITGSPGGAPFPRHHVRRRPAPFSSRRRGRRRARLRRARRRMGGQGRRRARTGCGVPRESTTELLLAFPAKRHRRRSCCSHFPALRRRRRAAARVPGRAALTAELLLPFQAERRLRRSSCSHSRQQRSGPPELLFPVKGVMAMSTGGGMEVLLNDKLRTNRFFYLTCFVADLTCFRTSGSFDLICNRAEEQLPPCTSRGSRCRSSRLIDFVFIWSFFYSVPPISDANCFDSRIFRIEHHL